MKNMEDLYLNLEDLPEDTVLIDVRSPEEYSGGSVPGAKNIPHTELSACDIQGLQSAENIVVFCQMGGRAGMAHESLKCRGLDKVTCINENGMAYWYEKGYPLHKG